MATGVSKNLLIILCRIAWLLQRISRRTSVPIVVHASQCGRCTLIFIATLDTGFAPRQNPVWCSPKYQMLGCVKRLPKLRHETIGSK